MQLIKLKGPQQSRLDQDELAVDMLDPAPAIHAALDVADREVVALVGIPPLLFQHHVGVEAVSWLHFAENDVVYLD